ncbi:MAG: zf-HC2 domain-containing protein [Chloracidobacterium sp.]|nr:zf-HC2 domain-containing protein [Chloracidobacterium sp.]
MKLKTNNFECPLDEIAAYIDGELTFTREIELDAHFAACEACSEELNQQKQFLCELDAGLKGEDVIALPADFTKTIVANAESTVAGLRRPRERFNALFICAGLFLFALFALGSDAGKIFNGLAVAAEQVAAVGSFFGHLVYSIFLGLAIVVRSFAVQFRFDLVIGLILTAAIFACLMLASRRALRLLRAQ